MKEMTGDESIQRSRGKSHEKKKAGLGGTQVKEVGAGFTFKTLGMNKKAKVIRRETGSGNMFPW